MRLRLSAWNSLANMTARTEADEGLGLMEMRLHFTVLTTMAETCLYVVLLLTGYIHSPTFNARAVRHGNFRPSPLAMRLIPVQPFYGHCGRNKVKIDLLEHRRTSDAVESTPHSLPWLVSLRHAVTKRHFCTASLLRSGEEDASDALLTAPACVIQGEYEAVLGAHVVGRGTVVSVVDAAVNVPNGVSTDGVAIMWLSRKVKFNDDIQPACFPPTFMGKTEWWQFIGMTAGWGADEPNGTPRNELHQLRVAPIPSEQCAAIRSDYNKSSMFCARKKRGGREACQGDTGSPYLASEYGEKGWTVYGVSTRKCDQASYSSTVYVRVQHYYEWISSALTTPIRVMG